MTLGNVNLNLLVILDAVLQERSVSRAAARLGRSQPAISHALQRLRHLFGDELLVRAGRRYKLTPVAKVLADPLHASLKQMSELLVKRPTFNPQTAEREFNIGVTDFAAMVLLRPLLRKITVTAPNIRFNIIPPGSNLVVPIRNGDQDLAIYPRGVCPQSSDLCSDIVLRDTWCCVAWVNNPVIKGNITREVLQSLPHVIDHFTTVPEQGTVSQMLAAEGIYRKHVMRTNHILLMPFLIEGTSALAIMQTRLAHLLCQSASLRIYPLPFELPELTHEMYWSAPNTTDPGHTWLRNLLLETAQPSGLTGTKESERGFPAAS